MSELKRLSHCYLLLIVEKTNKLDLAIDSSIGTPLFAPQHYILNWRISYLINQAPRHQNWREINGTNRDIQ